jgi:membrane protein DedA with SNARE-associated domain
VTDEPAAADQTQFARAVTSAGAETPAAELPAEQTPAFGAPAAEDEEAAARPASVWDNANLPWQGKPRRADIICWAGIVGSGFFYLALLPFRAVLVGTYPLLGVALNGATESLVAAAAFARVGHGSLWVVILVAIPALMKFDLLFWWAGRLWGERVIVLLAGRRKGAAKYMERVRRWGRWFIWPAMVLAPFLPIPTAIIYVIAGWSGMSWITFLVLDLMGTMLWTGLLTGLGYALGHHGVVVAEAVSHYALWFTIAIIVLVIASQVRTVRMHR